MLAWSGLCLYLVGGASLMAQHNYELYNQGDVIYISPGEVVTVRGDVHMQGGQLANRGFLEVQGNLYSDSAFQQTGTGTLRLENNDVNVADTQFVTGSWAVRGGQAAIGVDDGSFYDLELANTQGVVYLVGTGNVADVRNSIDFQPAGASGTPPANRLVTHDLSTGVPTNGSGYSAVFGLMNPTPGFSGLTNNTVSSNGNSSPVDVGYIQGRFRRAIAGTGGQYPYVLGLEPAGTGSQRGVQYVRLDFGANDYDVVAGYFETGSPNVISGSPVECGFNINYFGGLDHGEWIFDDLGMGRGSYEVWVWPQDDNFAPQSTWFITKDDSVRGNLGQCGPSPVGLSRSAFSGFSEFGVAGGTVVFPVTLAALVATPRQNAYIEVGWTTVAESNSERFEVERAVEIAGAPQGPFRYLGERVAAGNSAVALAYTWDDYAVTPDMNYWYRLKMVDRDGSFEYTAPVRARLEPGDSEVLLRVFPNPSTQPSVWAEIIWPEPTEARLALTDARGRLVHTGRVRLEAGLNRVSIPLAELAVGLYQLRVTGRGRTISRKLVRSGEE
ncbi:MAG: T9SS type A sorting domain-containing protein [Bacteroidota bacterium]